eukprot:COSAG01_NODE_1574_length_9861_cov_8.255071_2_plen_78_part_00
MYDLVQVPTEVVRNPDKGSEVVQNSDEDTSVIPQDTFVIPQVRCFRVNQCDLKSGLVYKLLGLSVNLRAHVVIGVAN